MNNLILKSLIEYMENVLNRCGLMYRIFGRTKTEESIRRKFQIKNYVEVGKKMQDFFGIRVTLYFSDDKELLYNYLKESTSFVNESNNKNSTTEFCPQVLNLVMKLPEDLVASFEAQKNNYEEFADYIDNTYEVQIRTVLSEGWHEVEHDLRYKFKDDWTNFEKYDRLLNGVFATLETSEWSMLSIFDNLAHAHYKKNNWSSVLRFKMRLRFHQSNQSLSDAVSSYLNDEKNNNTSRHLFKTERYKVIKWILDSKFDMPLTCDTVLFILNRLGPKDNNLIKMEPGRLTKEFDMLFGDCLTI